MISVCFPQCNQSLELHTFLVLQCQRTQRESLSRIIVKHWFWTGYNQSGITSIVQHIKYGFNNLQTYYRVCRYVTLLLYWQLTLNGLVYATHFNCKARDQYIFCFQLHLFFSSFQQFFFDLLCSRFCFLTFNILLKLCFASSQLFNSDITYNSLKYIIVIMMPLITVHGTTNQL